MGAPSGVLADTGSTPGHGIELRRIVEQALRFPDGAEDLAVANGLAAQAVGDRLQEGIAIPDRQRAGGAKNLVELVVG
jgi:hypothetical protein